MCVSVRAGVSVCVCGVRVEGRVGNERASIDKGSFPIRLECGAGDLGIVTRLGFQCHDQLAMHEPGNPALSILTDLGDKPHAEILLAIEAFACNRSSVLV